jgi:arylsulfatase A
MRRRILMAAVVTAAVFCGCVQATAQSPNIILVLGDDMPWAGTSVAMMEGHEGSFMSFRHTPNIARLAGQGMTFSNAYTAAGMCAPSRCSLQTGMTTARHLFSGNGNFGDSCPAEVTYILKGKNAHLPYIEPSPMGSLSSENPTIAEALKPLGYATAHIGKWHIYGGGPEEHGYDVSTGETSNNEGASTDPRDPKLMFSITEKSIAFMEEQAKAGRPFYLQMSHYAGHNPVQFLPETLDKHLQSPEIVSIENKGEQQRVAQREAMMEDLDTSIGMMLRRLEELGLADNTYVIFTADNGFFRYNAGNEILRGGKWWLWEGGIRVPFIVRGPGIKAGTRCAANIVNYDYLPTFVDMAGGQADALQNIDGISFKPLLSNPEAETAYNDRDLYFHYPHPRTSTMHSSIIRDNYKLLYFYEQPDMLYLYDLNVDIGESMNLTQAMPEKAAQMYNDMNAYFSSIGAYLPKSNPDADPNYVPYDPDRDTPPVGQGSMVTKRELAERANSGKEAGNKLTLEEKQERREERRNQRN